MRLSVLLIPVLAGCITTLTTGSRRYLAHISSGPNRYVAMQQLPDVPPKDHTEGRMTTGELRTILRAKQPVQKWPDRKVQVRYIQKEWVVKQDFYTSAAMGVQSTDRNNEALSRFASDHGLFASAVFSSSQEPDCADCDLIITLTRSDDIGDVNAGYALFFAWTLGLFPMRTSSDRAYYLSVRKRGQTQTANASITVQQARYVTVLGIFVPMLWSVEQPEEQYIGPLFAHLVHSALSQDSK